MGVPFSELLIKLLSPLFTAAETYPGLILIQAATAFFWFIGVHGPSIVQPGIDPIRLANQAENLQVLLAGGTPPTPSPLTCRSWVNSAAPAPRSSCRFC